MTIDEAISIIEQNAWLDIESNGRYTFQALQLAIEALKCFRYARKGGFIDMCLLLPGETK